MKNATTTGTIIALPTAAFLWIAHLGIGRTGFVMAGAQWMEKENTHSSASTRPSRSVSSPGRKRDRETDIKTDRQIHENVHNTVRNLSHYSITNRWIRLGLDDFP